MIVELLENLLTPCSLAMRKVGYLRGQIGIQVRHRHCRSAWRQHLLKTKQVIREAIALCPQRRKAVILGSGLLLDVPLAELSQTFREVILVDVVHPLKAYLVASWYRNVRLIRADVTDTAAQLTKVAKTPSAPLPRATPMLFCGDSEIDYVASVNLASQLPYLPTLYLDQQRPRPETEVNSYARDLVESHFDYLRRLPGVVSLITDVEKLQLDATGNLIERFDILYGARLPWRGEEWIWEHVPIKHISREFAYHRRVCAIRNVRASNEPVGGSLGKKDADDRQTSQRRMA